MARVATATLNEFVLRGGRGEEVLLAAARRKGGFTIAIERQLRRTVLDNSKRIARKHTQAAVQSVRQNMMFGFGGAQAYAAKSEKSASTESVSVNVQTVSPDGEPVRFANPLFRQLHPSTVRAKASNPGRGKFWQHYGSRGVDAAGRETFYQIASGLSAPKVYGTTRVLAESERREFRNSPNRIDFMVGLSVGPMQYQFEELVRRPLISGQERYGGKFKLRGRRASKENVIVYLELGADGRRYVPARPWIRDLSATFGRRLYQKLRNQ